MRLILLGPPGCGKGTQAKLLTRECRLEHIGTGDILREAIRQNTPAGAQARAYVEAGHLVPDEVVNALIAERFRRDDRPARFVMDGYPRTVAQAAAFDRVLGEYNLPLAGVILIQVPDGEIVKRLSGRWSCPKLGCKATYHTVENPPKVPGICDEDGTVLVQREDDREDTVRRRLVVYHKNTERLVPHYEGQGLLQRVNGVGAIDQVHDRIAAALKKAGVWC